MKITRLLVAFCIVLFSSLTASSQSQIENPSITPVSPESASLGRYGNVALTGATGQMSYSVPIYDIQVDGNSWPIALNYNYGGLILEGKPSLAGLGWNLTAYGSITKETRGLPDGHPEGYYGGAGIKAEIEAVTNDYFDGNTLSDGNPFNVVPFDDLNKFLTGQWDSEVDKYTVNVGRIRFSFKVYSDANNEPVPYYLSRHNYKVEIEKDTYGGYFKMASFVVTDDQGTEYYFGKKDANSDYRERIVQDPYDDYAQDNMTSWLLYEIKYVNGQSIEFDYDTEFYFSYDYVANGYELDLDASTAGQNPTNVPVQNWAIGYGEQTRVSELERQILKTITFPQGSIHVTTSTASGRTLFNSITLKDHNNSTVDSYDLTYMGDRDALTKIAKNNERFYDFEYFGVHTPGYIPGFVDSQFSVDFPHDQDYWKYYNNANNTRAIHLPFSDELANKMPNFSATRLGALKRIIYPTGGFTEIEYEQNQEKVPYESNPTGNGQTQGYNEEFFIRVDAHTNNSDRYATITKTFDYPVRASLYHKIKGSVIHGNAIYLTIEKLSGEPDSNYGACYGTGYSQQSQPYYPFELDNARSYLVEDPEDCPYYPFPILSPRLVIEHDPDNHCVWWGSPAGSYGDAMGCVSETEIDALDDSGGDFFIVPGTYKFTINVTHLGYDDLFAEIGLRWYDPAEENGGTLPDFMNANVGGIRVNKIIDYTDDGDYANVKHFNYNDDEGFSTARLNQRPFYKNEHVWYHTQSSNTPQQWTHTLDEYLLNSYTALDNNHGIPVYYSQIITHTSNSPFNTTSYPNGYTIQKFSLPAEDISPDTHPYVPRAEDITKAVPEESFVKNASGATVSSNSKDYTIYRWLWENGTNYDESPDHPWSFKYYKKLVNSVNWDCNCYELPTGLDTEKDRALKALHDIKFYKEANVRRLANNDETTSQGVTSSQTLNYDSDLLLQSVVTYDSQGNEIKVEYDYPQELSESQYQNMASTAVNQVAVPVVQRSYRNGVLTSQQKTNFTPFYDLGILQGYKPKEILTAKGSETLTGEIKFIYDNLGRIREYVRNEGTSPPTSFIWGYDETVPVAKIDNATYTQASSNITGGFTNMQGLDGQDLRDALDGIRSGIPEAQVTTYTYDPLIGVSSITNPTGETVHYTYDNKNRLQYVKDEDLNVLEEYRYHFRLEELTGSLSSSVNHAYLSQVVQFTTLVQGGTGNYSYEWTVSHANGDTVSTTSTGSFSVLTKPFHQPSFTLTCKVTDTSTNEFITLSRIVNVSNSLPPLVVGNITASPSSNIAVGDDVTYSISASGGSGNYTYYWRKGNGQGNTDYGVLNHNSITKTVISYDCTSFTIYCTVTDTETGNSVNKWVTVNVSSGCSGGNQ